MRNTSDESNVFFDEELDLFSGIDDVSISSISNNQINLFTNINDTNYVVSENEINESRMLYLKENVTPLFISLLKYEDFEFGHKSESIKLIQNELRINRIVTINWLNDIFLKAFTDDDKVLIGLLRVLEYFDEDTFYPTSQVIALAALSHQNDEVKELAVRAFENWGSIKSYEILKKVHSDTSWLKAYINEVLKDIELELCLS
ncbi:hypothetical protein H4K35_11810 [Myroides sp. NP-2]|uniref:hypothetical protein n=1 Tax=Myroides sp. NP-2 TaxID=2759945 RepID=UPI0015FDA47E|nr:hypothetical protein [Myroides sp. NP-2]MBB1150792.1 hypothetical protein [Myroides sp. NP-2]